MTLYNWRMFALDPWFRYFNFANFFTKGWGNPDDLRRILAFRKVISNRKTCQALVSSNYPICIDKEEREGGLKILHGHFTSPFVHILQGVMPKEVQRANFRIVLPSSLEKWRTSWGNNLRPICLQIAGTGDHGFWLRKNQMAKQLIKEAGIASILLENPYYGERKPKEQFRSGLQHVSDLFVMGGALVLEALALYHWCERNDYGPFGLTGISMGGHMACLAACNWPKPVPLIPCLSWTTASPTFTRGKLSDCIPWHVLQDQFFRDRVYEDELTRYIHSPEGGTLGSMPLAFKESQKFIAENYPDSIKYIEELQHLYEINMDGVKPQTLLKSNEEIHSGVDKRTDRSKRTKSGRGVRESSDKSRTFTRYKLNRHNVSENTMDFMRRVMDECTHLANFSAPLDTGMVVIVAAKHDLYIPRDNVIQLNELWPGSEMRFIDTDHVGACLMYHKHFREAIVDSFDRYIRKYHPAATDLPEPQVNIKES